MTPYQHSKLGHRQRMLAGLNTLGFVAPSDALGMKLVSNQSLLTKTSTGGLLTTTAVAPPMKTTNTVTAPVFDLRNMDATNLLTETRSPALSAVSKSGVPISPPPEALLKLLPPTQPVVPPAPIKVPTPIFKAPSAQPVAPVTETMTDPGTSTPPPSNDPVTSLVPVPTVPTRSSVSPALVVAGVGVAGLLVYLFVIR